MQCLRRQASLCLQLLGGFVFPPWRLSSTLEKNGHAPFEITAWSNKEVWWRNDKRGSWRQAVDVGSNRHSKYDTAGIAVLGPSQLLHLAACSHACLQHSKVATCFQAELPLHAHFEACHVSIQQTCFKSAQVNRSDGMGSI